MENRTTPTLNEMGLLFHEFAVAVEAAGGITAALEDRFADLLTVDPTKADAFAFRCRVLRDEERRWSSLAKEAAVKSGLYARQREDLLARVRAYLEAREAEGIVAPTLPGEFYRFQFEDDANGGRHVAIR